MPRPYVQWRGPLWRSDPTQKVDITGQVENYEDVVSAFGGYWSARFTIRDKQLDIEDWIENGLGRQIETYDDAANRRWEGFVNQVEANLGPLSITIGPLLDIANRVRLVYSTIAIDDTTGEPILGIRESTTDADDTASQALYAIMPKVLSTGGVEVARAADIRDTFLTEHAWPKTSKEFSSDRAGESSVTVLCEGYVKMLNYPYNSTNTGTVNTGTKIVSILGDAPNTDVDFDTTDVDTTTNTLQVPAWEDDDDIALALIKDITARGDGTDRYLFGIYNERAAVYGAAPTTLEYIEKLQDKKARIETLSKTEVFPWSVRSGRWLLFPDFLVGKTTPTNLREDTRAMFIESATYRAPWSITLTGGDLDELPQLLASMGISGVGA